MKTITRKSLLYQSGVDYGNYAINHIQGCSHGCRYPCYEALNKIRRKEMASFEEWMQPKIVENSLELLDKEIPRLKDRIKTVHLCFATDPFMYGQPEVEDLTLKIITKLNEACIKCVVLTKGILPKDLAIGEYSLENEYGITLVSLDSEFQKKFEPGAVSLDRRIESLKYLHDQGLRTWVSIEPYPTPNIIIQDLSELLEEIKFVDKIVFGAWNYSPLASVYEGRQEFYLDCVKELKEFCEKNKIEPHVKIKGKEFDEFRNAGIFQ
jgi:DNA repair photolyase